VNSGSSGNEKATIRRAKRGFPFMRNSFTLNQDAHVTRHHYNTL
jgi:hypothetical protein